MTEGHAGERARCISPSRTFSLEFFLDATSKPKPTIYSVEMGKDKSKSSKSTAKATSSTPVAPKDQALNGQFSHLRLVLLFLLELTFCLLSFSFLTFYLSFSFTDTFTLIHSFLRTHSPKAASEFQSYLPIPAPPTSADAFLVPALVESVRAARSNDSDFFKGAKAYLESGEEKEKVKGKETKSKSKKEESDSNDSDSDSSDSDSDSDSSSDSDSDDEKEVEKKVEVKKEIVAPAPTPVVAVDSKKRKRDEVSPGFVMSCFSLISVRWSTIDQSVTGSRSKEETGRSLEIETTFAREGNRDKFRFSASRFQDQMGIA